jgi:hypothetical protein
LSGVEEEPQLTLIKEGSVMKEFNCSVSSAGTAVDFHSNIDIHDLFVISDYSRWVPEMEVSNIPSHTGYNVYYTDAFPISIEFRGKDVYATMPWEMTNFGQTLLYLGYPLMEVQRQENQSVTIHAGVVSVGDCGILLLGESGSGKTTLAVKLCREWGAKLYSNDLSIIGLDEDGLYCSGGTKYYHLRERSVSRSLPELSYLFPESEEDSWLYKIVVPPEDLGVIVGSGKARIHSSYRIHIDETRSDLYVANADSLSMRLNLNENITRYIRNCVTMVTGGPGFAVLADVPSLDQPEFFFWRRRLMEMILEEIGTIYLAGPSQLMVQYILEHTR